MEKPKAEEEKQMSRIRKPDGRKRQKNKGENGATRSRDFHSGCFGMERRLPTTRLSDCSFSVFQSPVHGIPPALDPGRSCFEARETA
jgi:hypothetical protein